MTDVAVIGSGNVGGTLARALSRAGHHITLSVRDPGKPEVTRLADEIGAQAASVAEAVRSSSVALFAIPGASMAETVGAPGWFPDEVSGACRDDGAGDRGAHRTRP